MIVYRLKYHNWINKGIHTHIKKTLFKSIYLIAIISIIWLNYYVYSKFLKIQIITFSGDVLKLLTPNQILSLISSKGPGKK